MQKVKLYRYEEANGMVTITPDAILTKDPPERMRLIADENCLLTNGVIETPAIDVMLDEVDLWYEISGHTEATEADYINALEDF